MITILEKYFNRFQLSHNSEFYRSRQSRWWASEKVKNIPIFEIKTLCLKKYIFGWIAGICFELCKVALDSGTDNTKTEQAKEVQIFND